MHTFVECSGCTRLQTEFDRQVFRHLRQKVHHENSQQNNLYCCDKLSSYCVPKKCERNDDEYIRDHDNLDKEICCRTFLRFHLQWISLACDYQHYQV